MFKRALTKPDGRRLWLYSRTPISESIEATGPAGSRPGRSAHLRWHPLRGEWVAYAGHRQARTFLPPAEFNPLAPARDPAHPTEVPAGEYDVAVFENLFPTLTPDAVPDPPRTIVETRPAVGAAEVVVFTQDSTATLGALPIDHVELLVQTWTDRYVELGSRDDVKYVFIFENRGVEVGVTLHHPHGQIYAYPFVPPIPARELEEQRRYLDAHGRGLLEDLVGREVRDGSRIVHESAGVVAWVPAFARYPYEVWLAPLAPRPALPDLTAEEQRSLAVALKTILMKFDRLWQQPFPYVMAFHQAPTDGIAHPEAHLHIELYPAYRMPGRLKYLAGSELGAGVFTADTLPEDKAAELRAVVVGSI
jgi:UDPglucose--hexose-1-phosphate uridylyltransferase